MIGLPNIKPHCPPNGMARDMIGKVLGFVRQLRDNIRPAMMEMQKVLI